MPGARQNTGQEAIVNLSKKIDDMLTVVAEQYEQQTSILGSLEVVMKGDISNELKKQTTVLMSIEAAMAKSSSQPAVDAGAMKEYTKAFGSMAQAIVDLIEKADEKAGDKLEKFFTKLAKGVNDLIKDVDKEKAEALAAVLFAVTQGVLGFAFWMTIATPLLVTSLLGSFLLGLNIKLLLIGVKNVDENSIIAVWMATQLGFGVVVFGFVMSLYLIFAIPAFLGAMAFGFTVRMLLKAVGDPGEYEPKFAAMNSAIMLVLGVLAFGFIMSLYVIFSVPAFIGSMAFGFTVRLLMKVVGEPSPEKTEQIQAIIGLGWGVLMFGLIMSLYIILAPTSMIGAVLFGLTVRLLLKAAGTAKEGATEAIVGISKLGMGVLWFGLAMLVYAIIGIPAMIGAVLFGATVRLVLFISGAADKDSAAGIEALGKLWKGVLLFGLMMVLWVFIGIPAIIGAVFFGITAFILLLVLKAMGKPKVKRGVKAMLMAGIAVAVFGLVFVLFEKFVTVMAVAFTLGAIALTALLLFFIGKKSAQIKKGAKVLLPVALGVAAIGGAMIVWMSAGTTWEGIGMLGATILMIGVEVYVIGKFQKEIMKGALALAEVGVALGIFSAGMLIMATAINVGITWEGIAMLGAVILGMGIIATVLGVGPIPGFAMAGAAVLVVLGAALAIFAVGFLIIATAVSMLDQEHVDIMGSAITTLGMSMVPIGLMSPIILLGAAASIVAGAALIPLTIGMGFFKMSGFAKEDGDNLAYGLQSVMDGFLGGKMPGGILAAIKFAAGAAARAALLLVAVGPMGLAGLALVPITASMLIFKKAQFGKEDSDNLEYMLGSIVRSFGIVTDYERQKKMGFHVNPFDLMLGIESLSGAGRVLAGLAEGVQAWANLEVNEWEVVDGGTAKAKLVIKGRRKLNESDFDAAAYGMAMVISAISKPFADVGKLEKGEGSGNPVLDAVFGGNFVSTGINALKRAGDTLVSLAAGVQAFANLEITTYTIADAGTKDAKLIPAEKRKMTDTEIEMAGINIGKIIGVVGSAFAKIGKQEKESQGIFSGGFVTKGVKSLAGVGDILGSVTDGVIKMAHNEIPQFTLIDGGTKDAKLVPGEPLILKDTDLLAASRNIGEILGVVAGAIAEIGKLEATSKGWFSKGYVGKGVAALGNVGDIVSKIADAVIKFATGSVPQFDVVGVGTPEQKLVPAKPLALSGTMITSAAKKIGEILNVIGQAVADFGKWSEDKEDYFKYAVDANKQIVTVISGTATAIEAWVKLKEPEKAADSMALFLNKIQSIFDPKIDPLAAQKLTFFTIFSNNVKVMGENANGIEKIATNMEKIQNSMKLFKEHVNSLDLKKLTLTNSMFQAIAAMSKNPEAMAKAIVSSMNKSFEELIKALKSLAESTGGNGNGNGDGQNPPFPPNETREQKKARESAGGDVAVDNAAASKAGAQKVYVVNAPAGWK